MDYLEEIAYRKEILDRAYKGIRPTKEERMWLCTHSYFNEALGYPYYGISVEHIKEKQWYKLRFTVEEVSYHKDVLIQISVASSKGQIFTPPEMKDMMWQERTEKPFRIICMEAKMGEEYEIAYYSPWGIFDIAYRLEMTTGSKDVIAYEPSNVLLSLAMLREQISDNKVRFRCNSASNMDFKALVFTLEWIEIDGKPSEEELAFYRHK